MEMNIIGFALILLITTWSLGRYKEYDIIENVRKATEYDLLTPSVLYSTVSMRCFVVMCCALWPNLQCGLVCPKDVVSQVLWFVHLQLYKPKLCCQVLVPEKRKHLCGRRK